MNLPILIQKIYGQFTFTGLYSFEFVDKNRGTITEIFFMMPPKSKNVSESTRSTTMPTLSGNYTLDAGNATKQITLSGTLFFQYVGTPDNPVARNSDGLENTISGFEELLKLRFMLIRYRDYTMTPNARMTVPSSIMGASPEIATLYEYVSNRVNSKKSALYDSVRLIFHDYDMDDHFFCRVDNFSTNQTDAKHIAADYTISIECYEPDAGQTAMRVTQTKASTNEAVDTTTKGMKDVNFPAKFDDIQADIGYNKEFLASSTTIETILDDIETENEKIQAGKSTAKDVLPILVSSLLENTAMSLEFFIETFLTVEQQVDYEAGTITIDDVVSEELLAFYNTLQKVDLQANSLLGILSTIPTLKNISYFENADDYTLTEEQFDSEDSNQVEDSSSFEYYTVLEGDTARIIALRELDDVERFIDILQINDITENDFIDGTLVGIEIKIPIVESIAARGEDNLVYEADYTNIDNFLYGADIDTSINDELVISATGDILAIEGIENVFDNIESRLDNNKGSLNVFNPDWGTISIDDSNAPLLVKINRYLTDVVSQIQADPRVESVKMNLDKLYWHGEVIAVPTTIYFIGTDETREVIV